MWKISPKENVCFAKIFPPCEMRWWKLERFALIGCCVANFFVRFENAQRVNALYFACHKFAHVDSATTVIACVPTLAYRGSTCHYKSMQEIDSVIVAIFAFPKGRLWSVFCELGGEQVDPGQYGAVKGNKNRGS